MNTENRRHTQRPARGRDRNISLRRRYERLQREHEQTRRVADRLARNAAAGAAVAHRDGLTGLVNRTELQRRLERLVGRGARVALLLLDLDRFKEVNDTLGHLAGDAVLQEFASRLASAVAEHATAARLGGDEFAVLLPGVRGADDARECAAAIRAALDAPVRVGDAHIEIQSSIGFAIAPDDGTDSSRLLHRADTAMYAAKRSGRGVQQYDPAHDPRSDARLEFAASLRQAMTSGAIVVHYQPIAALDRTPVRAEALARWRHASLGVIEPSEFIDGAEQSGLVGALTEYVLNQALRDLQRWRTRGRSLGVAVNIAAANVVDVGFAERLNEMIRIHDACPSDVTLELRESSALTLERAGAAVTAIHAVGVRLSVDDFGRAPSSLALLQRLPLHELKIDRRVVRGMLARPADSRLAAAIIGAGHALGLSVAAVGVETELAWRRLAELGCDTAQGYYLGRPLPAEDLMRRTWRHAA